MILETTFNTLNINGFLQMDSEIVDDIEKNFIQVTNYHPILRHKERHIRNIEHESKEEIRGDEEESSSGSGIMTLAGDDDDGGDEEFLASTNDDDDDISDDMAFYLGIGAACIIGVWVIIGPLICLIVRARRKWREQEYQSVPTGSNPNSGWFSRFGRGRQAANRATSPPRLAGSSVRGDEASIPLNAIPTITINQPYTATMTTFTTGVHSNEESRPLVDENNPHISLRPTITDL